MVSFKLLTSEEFNHVCQDLDLLGKKNHRYLSIAYHTQKNCHYLITNSQPSPTKIREYMLTFFAENIQHIKGQIEREILLLRLNYQLEFLPKNGQYKTLNENTLIKYMEHFKKVLKLNSYEEFNSTPSSKSNFRSDKNYDLKIQCKEIDLNAHKEIFDPLFFAFNEKISDESLDLKNYSSKIVSLFLDILYERRDYKDSSIQELIDLFKLLDDLKLKEQIERCEDSLCKHLSQNEQALIDGWNYYIETYDTSFPFLEDALSANFYDNFTTRNLLKLVNLEKTKQMFFNFLFFEKQKKESTYVTTCLGFCYYLGVGCKRNESEGIHRILFSATQNNPYALLLMGNWYYNGLVLKKSHAYAFKYYKLAAEQKNSRALSLVGICYLQGIGTKLQLDQALSYFTESSTKHDPHGNYCLGRRFLYGEGIDKDYNKAIECFKFAAAHNIAGAFQELAICYTFSAGIPKNKMLATKYFLLAMDSKDTEANKIFDKFLSQ